MKKASTVEPLFWSLDAVAAALDVSRRQLDTLRRRDDFPLEVRIGNGYPKFLVADIKAWAERQRVAA